MNINANCNFSHGASFSIMSFNLGAAPEDKELLLASFHETLNNYLEIKWKVTNASNTGNGDVPSTLMNQQKNVNSERIPYYLNVIALEQLANDEHKEIKEKFIEWLKLPTPEKDKALLTKKKEALRTLIDDKAIKPFIEAYHLELLRRMKDANPSLKAVKDSVLLNDLGVKGFMVEQLLKELREESEELAVSHVSKDSLDVLFLQEVGDQKRKFMEELNVKNYATHKFGQDDGYDTAILLNRERFTQMEDCSCCLPMGEDGKKDCAICVATDKNTGKRFIFASAHIPGFSYSAEGDELKDQAAKGTCFLKIYCKRSRR